MQPRTGLKKIQLFFEAFQSKYGLSKVYLLLVVFLLVILLISFIIPIVNFGRFFGTDDYSHLFHTQEMASSTGLSDFYAREASYVSNPGSGENSWNYPFGVWLFGATIANMTGLPPLSAEFLFVILFLCILVGSFYLYSSSFLETKEQQLLSVLFMLAMPSAAIAVLAYRPSVFILPFLFFLLYITFKEPVKWKLFPLVWLSIFVIVISHTGTFIFLITFSILFFLLYCLLWGKLSFSVFLVILSSFFIYIISLSWFPEIANQYNEKSRLLLSPGAFLIKNFNFSLPSELGTIFYQNMLVNQDIIFLLLFAALIFATGMLFRYINITVSKKYSQFKNFYPITLPISNISHSFAATPIWMGPIHAILSLVGFFRIDSRGKCMLISVLIVTLLPDMLHTAEGTITATGATREISFLIIIIPITTVLGFYAIITYLDDVKYPYKNLISLMVWILILLAIIVPPTIATTYYLPKIAGENYIIDGMKWMSNSGDLQEKVSGYGYRTVNIYTNMSTPSVETGSSLSNYLKLLRGSLFSLSENNVYELRRNYDLKYIIVSDKVVSNLGRKSTDLVIDDNTAMDKIYSSKDFGVYEIITTSADQVREQILPGNITLKHIGSSFQIETDVYNIVLNENYPAIKRFGSPNDNYLGSGYFSDNIAISGLRPGNYVNPYIPLDELTSIENSSVDQFSLATTNASSEIIENQIIYRTILKNPDGENEASLIVRYTFYPTTIKRDFIISHDWVSSSTMQYMNIRFTTQLFAPLNDFVIKNSEKKIQRHIYPAQDYVNIDGIVQDLYFYNQDKGIYIKIKPYELYPTSMYYKGSTLYNMSSIYFRQTGSIKAGDSFYVTQYLTSGDEITAEKNILTQDGISLSVFPNGMVPIILSGFSTLNSNAIIANNIKQGYQILSDENVSFTEILDPTKITEFTNLEQNISISNNETTIYNISPPSNMRNPNANNINLQDIENKNIKIIGSTSTGIRIFDNLSAQERSISSLIDYVNNNNLAVIGYMPNSMKYNLDTLKIVSEKKIPFMISNTVDPPKHGFFGLENKNPKMATYHGETGNVVLFPVSSITSEELSTYGDNSEIFSAWKATFDEAVSNDGMVFFIVSARHIGNPDYSENFKDLIQYAKNKGLTFTKPDIITNYLNKIQNIKYSGSIHGDMATINVTNNNDESLQGVTFRIVLPTLENGNYSASGGTIIKTITDNNQSIVYVNTDVVAQNTKEIIIEPDAQREKIVVSIPPHMVEGQNTISIKDIDGTALQDADVIIDTKYYHPDLQGNVKVDLTRGNHTVQIQSPGYEKYSTILVVKGRIYLIEQYFGIGS
jgi:hypothetical protein